MLTRVSVNIFHIPSYKYTVVLEKVYHYSIFLLFLGLMSAVNDGKEASVRFFNQWVEQVKRVVPEDRLLVFEAKQGWKPLCKFLDVPVPDNDYPR